MSTPNLVEAYVKGPEVDHFMSEPEDVRLAVMQSLNSMKGISTTVIQEVRDALCGGEKIAFDSGFSFYSADQQTRVFMSYTNKVFEAARQHEAGNSNSLPTRTVT